MIPDLGARLDRAARQAPAAPGLVTPDGALSRRSLLCRIAGAARAHATAHCVRPDDARVWLPWLAGGMLGGGSVRFDRQGTATPPPVGDSVPTPADPRVPCLAVQTSGSTGSPRALIRDRAAWLRCFAAEETALGLSPADRVLVLGQPAFSLTPYAALRALHLGAAVGVLAQVTPDRAQAVLAGLAPTVVYGAPPVIRMLARCAQERAVRAPVRRIIAGGARLTPVQAAAIRNVWPDAAVTTFYGAAETSYVTLNTAPDPADPADVGTPLDGVATAVAGDGRLRVRTPYAAIAEETADGGRCALADAEGWITLADRAEHTASGRLRLLGRADARINVGGALVDPTPLAQALERLPWVAEAAVVAMPDARRSQAAVALLVPDSGLPEDAVPSLRRVLPAKGELPAPDRVLALTGAVPRTAGGKLDANAIVEGLAANTLAATVVG